MSVRTRAPVADGETDSVQRVTPLELFFDLVFVFAITQVTSLASDRPTWSGLLQALAVLALLWWAWSSYAWLTNSIDPEEGSARLAVFAAMGALLVVSLAVPRAFGADALAFGLAYAAVRAVHLALYMIAAREDPELRGAIVRLARPALAASGLIVLAATFGGALQAALWAGALLIDYAGVALSGVKGWRVHPGHFVERHAGIIIIALGESIVDIGVGAHGRALTARLLVAALLGMAVAAALWWAYFDVVAPVAERRFRAASGLDRLRLARDSYTYLHFPMLAGIILVAFGIKQVIAGLDRPLDAVPATALYGGVALYLAGHLAFRLRNVGTLNRQRCVTAVLCLIAIPIATSVSALAALAVLAALCVGLVSYEALHFADARARVRAAR
jgi:low temperature requirement protein LtrA